MANVPADVDAITGRWLREVISTPEASPDGTVDETIHAARIGVDYGLMSELYRISWGHPNDRRHHATSGATGTEERMPPSRAGAGPGAVVVKLWEVSDEATDAELRFYQELAADLPIRVPRCYHAALDRGQRRAVLVLEDLSGLEQGDCLEPVPRQHGPQLARMLASLHGRFWEDRRLEQHRWLPRVPGRNRDTAWYRDRAERFLARFEDRLDAVSRTLLQRAADLDRAAAHELRDMPTTLLHRDLHLDNVLFGTPGEPPTLLDWSSCARGPAVVDLSRLLFVMGNTDDQPLLLDHYLDELANQGVRWPSAHVERALVAGVAQLFVTWTCGVAQWEPASTREQAILSVGIDRGLAAAARYDDALVAMLMDHDAGEASADGPPISRRKSDSQ